MLRCSSYIVFVLLWLLLLPRPSIAQITIDTTYTADNLVKDILLGNGVLVGNVKFTGKKHALGLFQDESNQLGLNVGLVLTTGNALYVPGPNKTSRSGWASDAPGDEDLETITRGTTYDASILEFDFITHSDQLSFEYVFASEEYPEYVGSKFNDVFAFFVEGPGLGKVNIALLMDGKTPISVNTVNNERNENYFKDNTYINTSDPFIWDVRKRKVIANENYRQQEILPKYATQFDGFTTVLTAKCKVTPNKIYHIKMAIADVGDGILDSGVILKGGSFRSDGDQIVKIDDHFHEIFIPETAENLEPSLTSATQLTRGIPRNIKIGSIEFEFDKYNIPANATATLAKVINQWHRNSAGKVYVSGHTDNWGSDSYNLTLSENRAAMVASALKALGIPEEKMIIYFHGESNPLQNNNTSEGRARNRRVELVVRY